MKKIFAIAILGILCLSIFLGFAQVSATTTSSDWPQYHGDSGHTGYTTDSGPTTNTTLWKYYNGLYGRIGGSPAVANGLVYFGSEYGNLTCVNATTGAWVWTYSTNGFEISSAAVANGSVYFDCDDGNLYCLNAQTGALVWIINSTNTAFAIGAGDLAVSNGFVYFTDTWYQYNGFEGLPYANVTCANATTGALVWGYGVYVPITNAETAPAVANGCVYFTDGDGNFDCINATNGAFIWTNPNGAYLTPSVANGYVYYAQYGGPFFCLNATTGAEVWNTTTGGTNFDQAIAYGNVYFGSADGNFYCLNALTGTLVWKYAIPNYAEAGSVSGNGYAYFVDNAGNIYCFNAQTGALVWQYKTGGSDSLPAIANGILYVGSWDDYMYAFGTSQTALQSATLSIGPSAQSITSGSSLTLSGTLSPSQSGTVTIYESIDGAAFSVLTAATLNSGSYSYKFSPSAVGSYQFYATWPGNSQYNSATSTTTSVTVTQAALKTATLSINASSSSVTVGSSLTLSGTISPSQSGTVTIMESINGSAYTALTTSTLSSGSYSYKFSPTEVGSYQFYASWPGNSQYNPAQSSTTTVSVTAVPLTTPTLTLKSSASSVSAGQTVTLSGTISPSATGTVTLSESVNGSAYQQIATPTLTSGAYSYPYTIPANGTYEFQASFPGNSQLNTAQSSVVMVSLAKTTTSSNTTLYIVIAVIAVVIIIIAAYYVMAMRPKTPAK